MHATGIGVYVHSKNGPLAEFHSYETKHAGYHQSDAQGKIAMPAAVICASSHRCCSSLGFSISRMCLGYVYFNVSALAKLTMK
jgi:hypothetical protein